ncbi:MAG TPA: histidine kinase [Euzebyales bacterium]|nr:histidine kinase [Euzebyales bacterium]
MTFGRHRFFGVGTSGRTSRLSRLSRRGDAPVDAVLAGALLVLSQAEVWLSPTIQQSRSEVAIAALVMTAVLAFRRRWPLVTALVVCGSVAILALVAGLPNAVFLLPVGLLALYSLGAYAGSERSVVGLAVALVMVPLGAVRTEDPTVTDLTAPVVLFSAAWAGGRAMRARRMRDTELQDENTRLVSEQSSREQLAAAEERRRIARELHDIVAHRVTTIVIQAESGAATAEDADEARRTFATIAASGRESLDELRRLLGLLREEEGPARTSPTPGLARLDALVEDVRGAGMPVETDVHGDLSRLPAGIDLALYRIIQESLTNALRHAGTSATLMLCRSDQGVAVEVRNPVTTHPGTRARGSGRGLAGMRERARVYDGSVTAEARDGHWVVQAVLPIAEVDR